MNDLPQYELHDEPHDHHRFTIKQQRSRLLFVVFDGGEDAESEAAEHHQKSATMENNDQWRVFDGGEDTESEAAEHHQKPATTNNNGAGVKWS